MLPAGYLRCYRYRTRVHLNRGICYDLPRYLWCTRSPATRLPDLITPPATAGDITTSFTVDSVEPLPSILIYCCILPLPTYRVVVVLVIASLTLLITGAGVTALFTALRTHLTHS